MKVGRGREGVHLKNILRRFARGLLKNDWLQRSWGDLVNEFQFSELTFEFITVRAVVYCLRKD